jgi:Fic family protein
MRLPQAPPDIEQVQIAPMSRSDSPLFGVSPTLPGGRYLPWDELRHRTPPEGLTPEEWWAALRFARRVNWRAIAPMERCYGLPFGLVELPSILRTLHEFDRTNVGELILSALGNPDVRVEYRIRQLIEEAISSSEIEGARPTTREAARQMLRERRAPASRDERMILNNLRAMERLREFHASKERLQVAHLLELHRILGEGALDVQDASGRFRTREHVVTVSDLEGNVWHTPPDARGIDERMEHLLAFAHGEADESGEFIHPIVRSIVAHFWLGYEHPFRDGNGRMARALYYWCMLRHGYEVAEFLSISGPIDRSPRAYYLALAHTESDGGDLTYFVLHQLEVMKTALSELLAQLAARATRLRQLSALVASFDTLNHRQRVLLDHAIRQPALGVTIEGHATSHGVHYMTARSDLAGLEQRGLLESRRVKKTKRYYPAKKLLRSARGGDR